MQNCLLLIKLSMYSKIQCKVTNIKTCSIAHMIRYRKFLPLYIPS